GHGSDERDDQFEQGRQAHIVGRGHRFAAWYNLRTGLDERDVDVEDVIEREDEAHAKHEQICSRKRPDRNSVLASKDHAWTEPCTSSWCRKIRCHNDPLSPTKLVLREGVLQSTSFPVSLLSKTLQMG